MENEHVENLLKTALCEIERVIDARTVFGEPINIEGVTLIPMIGVGFGFGAGGGSGKTESKQNSEKINSGTGGGAWIRPKALVVVDKQGNVKIESILDGASFAATKLGESIPSVMDRLMAKKEEQKKEG